MTDTSKRSVRITGYYPGVVGRIVALHATYYFTHWGLDRSFETQVGGELSEFVAGFQAERDGFWAAEESGELAGCIAIDGSKAADEGARLRWFIVDPALQGNGIGRTLLRGTLAFCRQNGSPRVFLWTFRGLDAARALYEREGFRLREEHTVQQWGRTIAEQLFVLDLDAVFHREKG